MSVALSHTSTGTRVVASTSCSWTHNATGDDALFVVLSFRENASGATVTFNGTSMTHIGTETTCTAGQYAQLWVFKLANPASGSYTVSVSWSGSVGCSGCSASYTGVVSIGTISVTAGNKTYTDTIGSGDMVVGFMALADQPANGTWTPARDVDTGYSGFDSATACGISHNTGTGSVSVTMNYNNTENVGAGITLTGSSAIASTLTATQQSYTLTGQASILRLATKIIPTYASIALTGQNALLAIGRRLSMVYGAFVLTGQNISYFLGKLLTATYGSFTVTGQDANLKIMISFIASQASYVVTGISANLNAAIRYAWTLTANTGSFVLTGIQALLKLRGWIFETKKTSTWDIEDSN